MREAANNQGAGGSLAGAGIGLGAGLSMAGVFSEALKGAKDAPAEAKTNTVKCTKCGADVKAGSKFCPECGNKWRKVDSAPNAAQKSAQTQNSARNAAKNLTD